MQYQKAVGMPPGKQNGTNSFLPVYQSGTILETLGDMDSAIACYRQCTGFTPAEEKLTALINAANKAANERTATSDTETN